MTADRQNENNQNNIPGNNIGIKINAVIMASGYSRRFGSDKLLYRLNGVPLLEILLKSIPRECFKDIFLVARTDDKLEMGKKYGVIPVKNGDTTDNASLTISLGTELAKDSDGCMFLVGDQPMLKSSTIKKLCLEFAKDRKNIVALGHDGKMGNPVIFPAYCYPELMQLKDNQRGKFVVNNHKEKLVIVQCDDQRELIDLDTPESLKQLNISNPE